MPEPAACIRSYVPEIAKVSRILLAELHQAHRQLIEQIANMEAITEAPACDPGQLASGRWKISQASLARRMLSARICDYLLPRIDFDQAGALKALQEADRELLRQSAAHVALWNSRSTVTDWKAYCRASEAIRDRLAAHVHLERKVLCPILERASRLGA